jgi:hypothetical protein
LNSIPGRGSDYSLLHGGVQTGYGAQVTQKWSWSLAHKANPQYRISINFAMKTLIGARFVSESPQENIFISDKMSFLSEYEVKPPCRPSRML